MSGPPPGARCRDRGRAGAGVLGAVVGRDGHRVRDLRAGAEPRADDARRHQHLGAARARQRDALVVDPGPLDEAHLRRGATRCGDGRPGRRGAAHPRARRPQRGRRAVRRADRGAGVRALDPAYRLGSEGLAGGDVVAAGGLEVARGRRPRATPPTRCRSCVPAGRRAAHRGHRARARLDGGRASRGQPARLPGVAAAAARPGRGRRGRRWCCPGTARCSRDAVAAIEWYLAHRRQRLEQVRAAVAAGAGRRGEVVDAVYADVDRALWPAAELSVRAQLRLPLAHLHPARSGPSRRRRSWTSVRETRFDHGLPCADGPRSDNNPMIIEPTAWRSTLRRRITRRAATQALDVEQDDGARLQGQPVALWRSRRGPC